MKEVYILFECSGEYEDYIEHPLKAFVSAERAAEAREEYQRQKEVEREQYKLCLHCPIALNMPDTEEELEKDRAKCRCSFAADVVFDPEEGAVCPNEVWYTDASYMIVAVELEE